MSKTEMAERESATPLFVTVRHGTPCLIQSLIISGFFMGRSPPFVHICLKPRYIWGPDWGPEEDRDGRQSHGKEG
jgi:hypothetical protein